MQIATVLVSVTHCSPLQNLLGLYLDQARARDLQGRDPNTAGEPARESGVVMRVCMIQIQGGNP